MKSKESKETENSNRFFFSGLPYWGQFPHYEREKVDLPEPKPSVSLVFYDESVNEVFRKPLSYQIIGGEK